MLHAGPRNRRRFRTDWDEIHYRCIKAAYYLHHKLDRRGAVPHVARLRQLLPAAADFNRAILGQSAQALIGEFDEKWKEATAFRKREVQLTLRLYKSLRPHSQSTREFALQDRHRHEV